MIITSTANARVKRLASYRDRKARDAHRVFVVEGARDVLRLLDGGSVVREVVVDAGRPEPTAVLDALAAHERRHGRAPVLTRLGSDAFARVAYREHPDAVMAVVEQWSTDLTPLLDALTTAHPLLLVIEAVEKPGNLGALLRTADAAGVDAVVLCDPVVDVFHPNVVRNATAVLATLPVAVAQVDGAAEALGARGISLVAATPDAENGLWADDLDHVANSAVAIAVGAEHDGISGALRAHCQHGVRIPMFGTADSLNVATAAALVLYEFRRRREALRR